MSIGKIGTGIFVFVIFASIAFAQETPGAPQPPQAPANKASMLPEGQFEAEVIDSARLDRVWMSDKRNPGGLFWPAIKSPAENYAWFRATLKIKIAFGDKPMIGLLVNRIHAVDSAGQKHKLYGVDFDKKGDEQTFIPVEQFEGQAKITIDEEKKAYDVMWGVYFAKNAGNCMVLTARENQETASAEEPNTDNPLLFLVKNATQIEVTLLFQVPASARIDAIQLMPGKEVKTAKPDSAPQKRTPKKT